MGKKKESLSSSKPKTDKAKSKTIKASSSSSSSSKLNNVTIEKVAPKKYDFTKNYVLGGDCEDENCLSKTGHGISCNYCIERKKVFTYCVACSENEIPRRFSSIENQKKWKLTYRDCICGNRLCDPCWQSNVENGEFYCSLTPTCAEINRLKKASKENDGTLVSL